MIVFIDTFSNSLSFIRGETKKVPAFSKTISIDYSLLTLTGKVRAINEINDQELLDKLKKEKNHQLILSDDVIGFSTFDVPVMSKRKMDDIFTTRFRLCFPNYNDYFINYYEFTRDEKNVTYFAEFAKRDIVNKIVNAFKSKGVDIKEINNFGSLFTSSDKSFTYPIATLIVGDYSSELIITKGNSLLSINKIKIGNKVLFNKDYYLHSSFNFNNDESLSFAAFMKESINTREEVNDQNILSMEKEKGISFTTPKEIRLLKDEHLAQYNMKNNFRKYYARLVEIIDFYTASPWFFPIQEVNVVGNYDVYLHLDEASKEDERISFRKEDKEIEDYVKNGINGNPLYAKRVQKERSKIDWAKFLTMDIGKKKKA